MNKKCVGRLALAIGMAALFPAASAEVYRWVDDQGRVHFNDRPPDSPPKKGVEKLQVRPGNVADGFRPTPPAPVSDAGGTVADPPPAPIQGPSAPKTGVDAAKASCEARKQAYKAARACFDACGKTICNGWSCARNTSACGHCSDTPMANC